MGSFFTSPQEEASRQQKDAYTARLNAVGAKDFNAGNTWNNYSMPYTYQAKSAELENWLKGQKANMNRGTASDISQGNQSIARRFMSQGAPVGGSLMNQFLGDNANDLNKNNYNAQAQLSSNVAGLHNANMEAENQGRFGIAQALQNANQFNTQASLEKERALIALMQGQSQAIGGMSAESPFGQVLGMANAALPFIPGAYGAGGFGQAAAGRGYRR